MRGICSREIYHHVYIYTWGHIYLCIYTYIHVSCAVFAAGRYVPIYIYTHVDTSIYIYTHTCRHIYLYIYTNTRFMRSFAAGRYVPVYIIYIYIYIYPYTWGHIYLSSIYSFMRGICSREICPYVYI